MEHEYSNEEVRDIIEQEGFGYAVTCYMGPTAIADPRIKVLWKQAQDAMKELENALWEGIEERY